MHNIWPAKGNSFRRHTNKYIQMHVLLVVQFKFWAPYRYIGFLFWIDLQSRYLGWFSEYYFKMKHQVNFHAFTCLPMKPLISIKNMQAWTTMLLSNLPQRLHTGLFLPCFLSDIFFCQWRSSSSSSGSSSNFKIAYCHVTFPFCKHSSFFCLRIWYYRSLLIWIQYFL